MTLKEKAIEMGFTSAVEFSPGLLVCRQKFRDMCKTCKSYGTCWVCPPHAPGLDALQNRLDSYSNALIVTSCSNNIDPLDEARSLKLSHMHTMKMIDLASSVPDRYILTAGGCSMCEVCSCPDEPCRKEYLNLGSISAHGIDVSTLFDSIEGCGNFEFNPDKITFVGIILW